MILARGPITLCAGEFHKNMLNTFHPFHKPLRGVQLLCRNGLDHGRNRNRLEQHAQGVDLVQLLDPALVDDHAAVWVEVEQSFPGQLAERLPYGGRRHFHALRQRRLPQPRSGRNCPESTARRIRSATVACAVR
jgi:hypothetical protein